MWAQTDLGSWASVATAVGSGGFSAFVAWWLLTRGIPEILGAFRSSLNDQQRGFEGALQAQRDRYDRVTAEHRADDKLALKAVLEHCEREGQRRDEAMRVEMSAVVKALVDQAEVLERFMSRRGSGKKGEGPPSA